MSSTTIKANKATKSAKSAKSAKSKKNVSVVQLQNERKELNERLKAIKAQLPKVETPAWTIAKRAIRDDAERELMSLTRVKKAVHRLFKGMSADDGINLINDKAKERFNAKQFSILVKSPTTVVKMMSDKEFETFKTNGNAISVTKYVNVILRASCYRSQTFSDKRTSKR